MTSFKVVESAAIGNDRETNYYVDNDFRKIGGIDRNFDCLVV